MGKYYQYYVEGQDEEKIIQVLKTELQLIAPGKVEKFNVVSEKFTELRIMPLKMGTIVVLVFDTDAGNIDTLKENIKFLNKQRTIKKVLCITQVKNLEDELKRSCNIKEIKELTGSKSNSDFKKIKGESYILLFQMRPLPLSDMQLLKQLFGIMERNAFK